MKTLDDVKQALEGLDNGIELYEAVSNAINGEKVTGINKVKEANRQIEGLKQYKQSFLDLGFNPDDEQADLNNFITDLKTTKDSFGKTKEQLSGKETELQKLQNTVAELTSKWESAEKEKSELAKKATNNKIKATLLKEMDSKIYSSTLHAEKMISSGLVSLADDGETILYNTSDKSVSLSEGLPLYFEQNKTDLKAPQKAGSNSSGLPIDNRQGKETEAEQLARLRKLYNPVKF